MVVVVLVLVVLLLLLVMVVVYNGWLDGWDVKLIQIRDRRQRRRQGVIYSSKSLNCSTCRSRSPPGAQHCRDQVSRAQRTKKKAKRKERILGGVHDGGTGSTTGADVSMPSSI